MSTPAITTIRRGCMVLSWIQLLVDISHLGVQLKRPMLRWVPPTAWSSHSSRTACQNQRRQISPPSLITSTSTTLPFHHLDCTLIKWLIPFWSSSSLNFVSLPPLVFSINAHLGWSRPLPYHASKLCHRCLVQNFSYILFMMPYIIFIPLDYSSI